MRESGAKLSAGVRTISQHQPQVSDGNLPLHEVRIEAHIRTCPVKILMLHYLGDTSPSLTSHDSCEASRSGEAVQFREGPSVDVISGEIFDEFQILAYSFNRGIEIAVEN